jgi:hypothetical protein
MTHIYHIDFGDATAADGSTHKVACWVKEFEPEAATALAKKFIASSGWVVGEPVAIDEKYRGHGYNPYETFVLLVDNDVVSG